MAVSDPSSSVKSHVSLFFDELQKGFNKKEVLVRVIHLWEARNAKKGGLLMGLELLLIDQKGIIIQAFLAANRIGSYEPNLKADVVYKIKNFLVMDNKTSYRVSTHKFLIQFTQQTELVKSDQHDHTIERQSFRIRSYEEFKKAVDKNEDLYDAIGKVVLIDNEKNFNGVAKNKTEVHLQLKEGPIVRVTLWGNVAVKFQEKLNETVNKPVVLLATTVNPKTFRENLCLSSTSSTRIFFDNDVKLSSEYLTWLGESGNNSIITSEITKLETVTISELFQFLKNETPQIVSFCCIATVVDILPQYGWNYIACTKCKCKLGRTDTTLVCKTCNHENTVGLIRYRVELSVFDKDNVATFVIFDEDAIQITGRSAADILEADEKSDENGSTDNHSSAPQCLYDAVGRTFKFQIKFKPFDFTSTRQTMTVTSILKEIIDDDKTLQEETDTPEVLHGDEECKDDDTVGIYHKDKRIRYE